MPLSHDEALLLVFHAEPAAQPTTPHEHVGIDSDTLVGSAVDALSRRTGR